MKQTRLKRRDGDGLQARFDAEHLAQVLLRFGARLCFVSRLTGLSSEKVRYWNRAVGGKASSGPVPTLASSMIRTRTAQAQASLFAAIHVQAEHTGRTADPCAAGWHLVRSYERFLHLVPDLDRVLTINDASVISTNLRCALVMLEWCAPCGVHYLEIENSALVGCPVCALYAARAGGPRRRTKRRIEPIEVRGGLRDALRACR